VIRAALALALLAGETGPEELRFVTCPVYRDADSGKKSGCWLADDPATGARYDVSLAPSKPDWNHAVLVEGRLSADSAQPCGSPVLDAVRTSVLAESCTRHMLPAEGFPGRKFVLPKRNVRPMSVAREVPVGPHAARTFHLLFDFDQSFLIYQYDDYLLDEAIGWIRAVKPRAIAVTGYAATVPVTVSGRRIAEAPGIARERAEKIVEALVRLGVDRRIITVRWKDAAEVVAIEEADGLAEPSRRRVDIAVTP
jgi:outer membrane protein OmpA-like peptidoglycan-associated protein